MFYFFGGVLVSLSSDFYNQSSAIVGPCIGRVFPSHIFSLIGSKSETLLKGILVESTYVGRIGSL